MADQDWPELVALAEALSERRWVQRGSVWVWRAFIEDLIEELIEADANLAARNWQEVDPWTLITLADAGGRVANGVRRFLPRELDDLEPGARMLLYFLRLILAGVRTAQPDPFIAPVAPRGSRKLAASRISKFGAASTGTSARMARSFSSGPPWLRRGLLAREPSARPTEHWR